MGGWTLCHSIGGLPTYYAYPRIVLGWVHGSCVIVSVDSPYLLLCPRIVIGWVDGPCVIVSVESLLTMSVLNGP